ncbi:MAG: hypothetical protein LUI39_02665 [Lachnospiraceae bacterium]|nr:hypothetical protein [Lachnospiraceae bacterium]
MSEYRRFVAYFYEYAGGKKQQNAGFAKVELRDGMWRILFRLTIPDAPEPPLQVYGFVRENEYLHGFLLGTMTSGGTVPEEWAWRADTPVGLGKYYFGEMNGIRIESGEGRSFFTVWDDEAVVPERFVFEMPQYETVIREEEEPQLSEKPEQPSRPAEPSQPEVPEQPSRPAEPSQPEIPEQPPRPAEPSQPEIPIQPSQPEIPTPGAAEMPAPQITELPQQESPMVSEPNVPELPPQMPAEMFLPRSKKNEHQQNPAENLLQSRQRFRPFQDGEFTDCVQIRLCDILPLQQENWKVGRSNFLQHGYYLYRHLLLGRTKDGDYILGVPGMRNQQEEYMAQTFGYDHFKQSAASGSGRRFGYWYRILREPEQDFVSAARII